MLSLAAFFWIMVIFFAIVGAMRGWAKELLVTFSVVLAFFILAVLDNFTGLTASVKEITRFWVRVAMILLLAFFGYQTPSIPRVASRGHFAREKLQDTLLGMLIGAFNGYLIVGSIWYFLDQAGYPYPNVILPPDPNVPLGQQALNLLHYLPPRWLMTTPLIYFAVIVSFLFIIVVFI